MRRLSRQLSEKMFDRSGTEPESARSPKLSASPRKSTSPPKLSQRNSSGGRRGTLSSISSTIRKLLSHDRKDTIQFNPSTHAQSRLSEMLFASDAGYTPQARRSSASSISEDMTEHRKSWQTMLETLYQSAYDEMLADLEPGNIEDLSRDELTHRALEIAQLQRDHHRLVILLCKIEQSTDASSAIEHIITGASDLIDAVQVSLYRVDRKARELVCEVSQAQAGHRCSLDGGILGHVVRTRELLNVKSLLECEYYTPYVDAIGVEHPQNILCVPILSSGGRVVAVLEAVNKVGRDMFTRSDEYMMGMVAFFAADYLLKSVMLDLAHKASRKSHRLAQIVTNLSTMRNSQEENFSTLVDRVVQLANDVVNADRATLFLVDQPKKELWCILSQDLEGVRIPFGKGIVGHVAMSGETINLTDVSDSVHFDRSFDKRTGYTTRSLVCLPIFDNRFTTRDCDPGSPIAVLQVLNSKDGFFDQEDVDILEAFCVEVGQTLRYKTVDLVVEKARSDRRVSTVSFLSLFTDATLSKSFRLKRLSPTARPSTASTAVAQYNTFGLDVFAMDMAQMIEATELFFAHFNLLEEFNIPSQKFRVVTSAILESYTTKNPFHNVFHGFSVMHVSFLLLLRIQPSLSSLDVFVILLSALCHDVDHPGVTNDFLIQVRDPKALTYNDISVLENHHASTAFRILLEPHHDFFGSFPVDDARKVRKEMVQAILATDMAHHFSLVTDLQTLEAFDLTRPDDVRMFRNSVVHLADLSAQALPSPMAMAWSDRIVEEFKNQAAAMTARGLTVDPFMQNLSSPLEVAKVQSNFVELIVQPLWQAFASHFPDMLEENLENLTMNQRLYEDAIAHSSLTAQIPITENALEDDPSDSTDTQ